MPFQGPPILIAFAAEEPEIKEYVGNAEVEIFTRLGEQIQDVTSSFREIFKSAKEGELREKPKGD